MALNDTLEAKAVQQISGKNDRIELVPGGKNVNNQFVANAPKAVTPAPLPTPTFTPPNQINASSLSSASIPIAEAPEPPLNDFRAFVNSVVPDSSALTTRAGELRTAISEGITNLGTRGERKAELQSQFGIPQDQQKLMELNLQMAQLRNAFDTSIVNEEGVARPVEFITGRQAHLQNQKATQLGALAATSEALQGNIALAEQIATATIENEFADDEAELERLMFEFTENRAELERADKKGAEQLALHLDERSRILAERKDDRATVLAMAQEAALNGAPNSLISKIAVAEKPEDALSLAGSYFGLLDRQLKQAQIYSANRANRASDLRSTAVIEQDGRKLLIDSQTGEIIQDFGSTDASVGELQQAMDVQSISTLDSLKSHPGMSKAVGTTPIARWTPFKVDVTNGDVADFIASVDLLTKGLTLDELASAKDRGITFGALQLAEMKLVADAATKINSWRRTDGEGDNVVTTHYEASENDFKEELDLISNFRKLDSILKGIPPESVGVQQMEDGSYWAVNSDGTFTKLR